MSRRLIGDFAQAHPEKPLAPYLHVETFADIGRRGWRLPYLIDTGADRTLLGPGHAAIVFGETEYRLIMSTERRIRIGGVGTGASVVVQPVFLQFKVDVGEPLLLLRDLWVAAEIRDQSGAVLNRHMPSLLGRDILNHFTLTVSPPNGVLELIEEEAIPGSA